jgi:hypothetical protein
MACKRAQVCLKYQIIAQCFIASVWHVKSFVSDYVGPPSDYQLKYAEL